MNSLQTAAPRPFTLPARLPIYYGWVTLTVPALAIGPLLAACVTRTGSYALVFYLLALVVAGLGLSAWLVPLPAAPSLRRD